jgi:hypothetical protein
MNSLSPKRVVKSKSPLKKKSPSHINNESFIDCIHRVKMDLPHDPEKALECLHSMILRRKNVKDCRHSLIDKHNLYKSVVVYAAAHLTKDDINNIKRTIKASYRPDDATYQTMKHFFDDVKFEKYH